MSAINQINKPFWANRKNVLLVLLLLCIGVPVAARVSAMIFHSSTPPPPAEPKFYGVLTVNITVREVVDLYAWQTKIIFDSDDLCVGEIKNGDFLNVDYPFFVNATDIGDGVLLVGATLKADVSGDTGSGTLATVTFKIKCQRSPHNPEILFDDKTFLWNSNLEYIENIEELLTLEHG